jgi:uncharacterized delta-60 repeat protein
MLAMPVRSTCLALCALVALCLCPAVASASGPAASSLDPGFNGGGIRAVQEGGIREIHDMLDEGSRYLVVGEAGNAHQQLTIAAVGASGAVDNSFGDGDDGSTVLDLDPAVTTERIENVAIAKQVVGEVVRYVVAGTTRPNTTGALSSFVVRFNSDGTHDTTFNANTGIRTRSESNVSIIAEDVVVRPSGQIVLVGQRQAGTYTALLDLVSADGSSAVAIGDGLGTGTDEGLRAGAIDPDGKLVAVGQAQNFTTGAHEQLVTRWNLDTMALDTSFSGDGYQTIDYPGTDDEAWSVAFDERLSSARIIVGGRHRNNSVDFPTVSRLDGDGTLNAGFDEDGMKSIPAGTGFGRVKAVHVDQGSGAITAGGRVQVGNQRYLLVLRLLQGGDYDTNFDPAGDHDSGATGANDDLDKASVTLTDANNFNAEGTAMSISSQGKIVVAGFLDISNDGGDKGVIVRLLGDAAPVPVTISIDDGSVTEGGVATLTITKTGGAPADIRYSTATGTASTADFTPAEDFPVNFTSDQTIKIIGIQTTQDTTDEPDETFQVKLTTSDPDVTFADDTGVLTITDNDEPAVVATVTPDPTATPAATAAPTATPGPTVTPGGADDTAPKADTGQSDKGETVTCAASCKIKGPAYSEAASGTATVREGSGGLVAVVSAKKAKLKFKPAKFSVPAGVPATITLKFNAKNRKILKKRKKVKLVVTFVAKDSAGNVTKTPIPLTVKASRK